MLVSKEPTTTPTASATPSNAGRTKKGSEHAPAQIGGLVTLQPLLPRGIAGGGGLHPERNDKRLSPLPRLGEGDGAVGFSLPAPETSGGQYLNGNNKIETRKGAIRQEGLSTMPTSSSSSDLSDEVKSHRGGEGAAQGDGGDGDSVVAAAAENEGGRGAGSAAGEGLLRSADIRKASTETEGEKDHQDLHDVTPDERALSLPSSSLLAADGSGEIGLVGRSVRWSGDDGRGADADGNSKIGGGTVWSKRWVFGV